MERLYVLYDARCGFCRWARSWAMAQPAFVPLVFVAAGSDEAKRLFPTLWTPGVPEDLVAVGDRGEVYRGDSAWIMCLYALAEYREWANRLSEPMLRPLARQAFALVSRQRRSISRWLGLTPDGEVVRALRRVEVPACATDTAASGLLQMTETVAGMSTRDP